MEKMNQISARFSVSASRQGWNGRLMWLVKDSKTNQCRYYSTEKEAHLAVASVLNRVA
jgi:hypothetical protein